jgi:hypothetical protein
MNWIFPVCHGGGPPLPGACCTSKYLPTTPVLDGTGPTVPLTALQGPPAHYRPARPNPWALYNGPGPYKTGVPGGGRRPIDHAPGNRVGQWEGPRPWRSADSCANDYWENPIFRRILLSVQTPPIRIPPWIDSIYCPAPVKSRPERMNPSGAWQPDPDMWFQWPGFPPRY